MGEAPEQSPTLMADTHQPAACYAVRTAMTGANGCGFAEEAAHTLDTTGPEAVCYTPWDGQARRVYGPDGCFPTLAARKGSGQDQQSVCAPAYEPQWWEGEWRDFAYVLRRLMPVECERLQGFPDGWTDVEFRCRPASDTARYKALGNSMAVPVINWIGRRIQDVEAIF